MLKRTILTPIDILKKKIISNDISADSFYKDTFNSENLYKFANPKLQLSQIESIYYMRNQLLRDSDWSSMYHGVELRTPFVDTKLLENLKDIMNSYSSLRNKNSLKFSFDTLNDGYCEDSDGNELSNIDESSCKNMSSASWIDASCSFNEFTKQ